MNDSMNTLIVMAALAMLQEKGVVHALAYLQQNGYSFDASFDIIKQYEALRVLARSGVL